MERSKRISTTKKLLITYRQTGYSKMIEELAKDNDIIIITHNSQAFDNFDNEIRHKLVSLNDLKILYGKESKPLFFDNKTLIVLMYEYEYIIADNNHLNGRVINLGDEIVQYNKLLSWIKKTHAYKIYVTWVSFFRIENKFDKYLKKDEDDWKRFG